MGTESLQQTPAFGMVSEPRDQVTSLQTIILKVPGTERITRVYLSSLCIDMGSADSMDGVDARLLCPLDPQESSHLLCHWPWLMVMFPAL